MTAHTRARLRFPGHAPSRMTARAEIVAEADSAGDTRLPVLSSQAPLVLRRTPEAVYLIGGRRA